MKNIVNKIRNYLFGSVIRGFVVSYLLFMLLGAALLKLPPSIQAGVTLSWVDAIFISASALSTTGLTPIVVADTFTGLGLGVLLFIIQFGGIGLIMALALVWLFLKEEIGFSRRNMIMVDQNQFTRAGIVRFVKRIIRIIFLTEAVAIVLFFAILFFSGTFDFFPAIGQSMFTVISLFTNAGFDIAPNADSMFMYRSSYGILTLSMGLMFLGAVGFWPLYDVSQYVIEKFKKNKDEDAEPFRFQIFTKWFVNLHVGVWIGSAILLAAIEWTQGGLFTSPSAPASFIQGVFDFMFMSLTTRNAGFSTVPVTDFSSSSQLIMTFLMFLGSSPNSAGGGIRTITFMLAILSVISLAKGRKHVIMKHRSVTIKDENIRKSLVVVIMATLLVFIMVVLISLVEPFAVSDIAFEVSSAFGTTGLSTGITSALTVFSKWALIVTMFIGRIGLVALISMFSKATVESNVSYPEVDVIVG